MASRISNKEDLKYSVTTRGLGRWMKAMFEKFGWMLLHKRDGRSYKVAAYISDLAHFDAAVRERILRTNDKDRKLDLEIMLKNAKTLHDGANRVFSPPSGQGPAPAPGGPPRRSRRTGIAVAAAPAEPAAAAAPPSPPRYTNNRAAGAPI